MSTREKLSIYPSRANFVMLKNRIAAANRGLSLLKRKRDAFEMKIRELQRELSAFETVVHETIADAIFTISKAHFLGTDFKPATITQPERADVFMNIKRTKVVGTMLPTFNVIMKESESCPLTGLSHGGLQVNIIRQKFRDAIKLLVDCASLKYSVKILQEALHTTNMRMNGLEYVLIPRFENTVSYIRDELDEYEREDFYRLKKSRSKQQRNKEAFAAIIADLQKAQEHPKWVDDFDMEHFDMERK